MYVYTIGQRARGTITNLKPLCWNNERSPGPSVTFAVLPPQIPFAQSTLYYASIGRTCSVHTST